MRGIDPQQADMYSYVSPEARVRADHPLRATLPEGIINACYSDRGADSSAETCTYGSQPSGSGSVVLHHFAPPLNQAALSVLVDVFASWYPNSVPQQGQMLKSDGGSSIP